MDKAAGENRLKVLEQNKKFLEDQIAASRATIKLLDPMMRYKTSIEH